MERQTTHPIYRREHAAYSPVVHAPRTGLRRQVPQTALINFGLHYSQRWPIRDLSPSGAFVEMPLRGIREGMTVEFVLHTHRRGQQAELRLPARVVRLVDNGVALSFGGYDDPTYTEIVNLLYSG